MESCLYNEKEVNKARPLFEAASSNVWSDVWAAKKTWLQSSKLWSHDIATPLNHVHFLLNPGMYFYFLSYSFS